jgi:integrase
LERAADFLSAVAEPAKAAGHSICKPVRLTKAVIERAPLPATGYYLLRDSGQRGLAIRITAGGSKSFVYDGRLGGVQKRITLKAANVEQARREVQKLRGGNETPMSKRAPILEDFFATYLERHARPNKKSWAQDKELFKSVRPTAWLKRRLSAITTGEISEWHDRMGRERGRVRANRGLTLLRTMYNKAREWRIFHDSNPCDGIKLFKERSRTRFLNADELRRLNAALLEELNPYWRGFFQLSYLLGTRKSELLGSRWERVDFNAMTLTLPDTKSGEDTILPLSAAEAEILRALPSREKSEWLFPGVGASGHLREAKSAWKRLTKRAELEGVRIHDLRRTTGSWLAMAGHGLPLIGKALGHVGHDSTEVYARLQLEPVRAAKEALSRLMLEAADTAAVPAGVEVDGGRHGGA